MTITPSRLLSSESNGSTSLYLQHGFGEAYEFDVATAIFESSDIAAGFSLGSSKAGDEGGFGLLTTGAPTANELTPKTGARPFPAIPLSTAQFYLFAKSDGTGTATDFNSSTVNFAAVGFKGLDVQKAKDFRGLVQTLQGDLGRPPVAPSPPLAGAKAEADKLIRHLETTEPTGTFNLVDADDKAKYDGLVKFIEAVYTQILGSKELLTFFKAIYPMVYPKATLVDDRAGWHSKNLIDYTGVIPVEPPYNIEWKGTLSTANPQHILALTHDPSGVTASGPKALSDFDEPGYGICTALVPSTTGITSSSNTVVVNTHVQPTPPPTRATTND